MYLNNFRILNLYICFFFFFSSRRRHTRCALVTGVQTCALPISFNTAIAAVMELMNEATRGEDATPQGRALQQEVWESVALMLQPIVPHIAHTLWQTLRGSDDVLAQRWQIGRAHV